MFSTKRLMIRRFAFACGLNLSSFLALAAADVVQEVEIAATSAQVQLAQHANRV